MENELGLYYDVACTKKVVDNISFDPIPAGEVVKKSIYIKNEIKYDFRYDAEIIGDWVALENPSEIVGSNESKELKLIFSPKVTLMQPISAQLKIKIKYTLI